MTALTKVPSMCGSIHCGAKDSVTSETGYIGDGSYVGDGGYNGKGRAQHVRVPPMRSNGFDYIGDGGYIEDGGYIGRGRRWHERVHPVRSKGLYSPLAPAPALL